MDFSYTLQAFGRNHSVSAYEKRGELKGGRWVKTIENRRAVNNCILLNIEEKTLELIAEGNLVDEAYCVMFQDMQDTFYIADQQNADIQPLQTFLEIDGKEFIVMKNPATHKNANFKSYYAIRYKDIKNDVNAGA
jgi:hypothetical protein|nr:MAG TPA: hypothetical protein [Caudoviricetes sp.]